MSTSVGLARTSDLAPRRRATDEVQRLTVQEVSRVQWGRAVEPGELGLVARWALRAAARSGPEQAREAVPVAAAAELTERALQWHAAAAAREQPVGLGTLAGDYCLAQAAELLTRCRRVEVEAAFADGLANAAAALATGAGIHAAVRELAPAAGWAAAQCAGLSGEQQARWWRGGLRLRRPGIVPSRGGRLAPELVALLSSQDPVERRLGHDLGTDPDAVAAPMARLLSAGGKRIRARLVMLAGEVGPSYRPELVVQGAAAMEILHAATLCHDDLVDGAASRRGAPTVASSGGPLLALGVGDFYLGRASGMVARLGDPRISRAFARALVEIAEGQLMELGRRSVWSSGLMPYVRVARRKTGSLLVACAAIGARVSWARASEVRAVTRFASDLGLAFQGIDDCLDFSDPQRTGKPAGIDLAQGICGLPVLCALRGPRRAEVVHRLRLLEGASAVDSDRLREEVVTLVHESGALATARTVADGWSGEALVNVARLPEALRSRFERFADRLTLRDR